MRGRSEERNVKQIGSFASSKEDDCTQKKIPKNQNNKEGSNELMKGKAFLLVVHSSAVVFLVARMVLEGERFKGGWIKPILLKTIEDSVSWLREQLLKQSWEESQDV